MNRLAELIRSLPAKDIELIKRDVEEGNLQKVLNDRIAELDIPQKVCPVCHTDVSDNAPFVLYFGTSIRQKARFDAIDCLQFFLKDMQK
ncbi:hypothetical protein GOV11_04580 [Candidatus Woesearchaeota archaeon]|nr:hypothetical protein [Candidatus Woesearchaeota archaeon]